MNKTVLTEVNGWTPVIDAIVEKHGILTATVFGKVWRYCQMEDGVCTAAQQRMADELKISRVALNQHIDILVTDGYLADLTPNLAGKPHTYRDTGKAGLSISFTAHPKPVNEIDNTCKADLQQPVNEIDTKIVLKKDIRDNARSKIVIPGIEASIRQNRPTTPEDITAHEKTFPGSETIPEEERALLTTYYKMTGQKPTKGQLMDWYSEAREWVEVGIIQDDLRRAYEKSKEGTGFLVNRPGSLTRTAGMFAGERRKKTEPVIIQEKKQEAPVSFDPNKPFYEQFPREEK